MQATYTTSEVAAIIGIHPNTVCLYEELKLITVPQRKENGYRVFSDLHLEQFRNARLAFQVEVLQNAEEAAEYLGVTIDTLRNWELNGLLVVKRKVNGYPTEWSCRIS